MTRRIKIALQYDGTPFNGWQIQSGGVTVQGIFEESLRRITGEKVRVVAAGRTDAGVHALEQVASFDSSSRIDNTALKRALNAVLPKYIRVLEIEDAGQDFHARCSALRKRYSYVIANTPDIPVFIEKYAWWIRFPLDVEAMKAAAGFLLGTHDFSSFRGSGCGAKNPVREIYAVEVGKTGSVEFLFTRFRGDFILLAVEANGFLRHMVRNIAGTLVEVGRGKIAPEEVKEILESRERRLAGPTAPAKGLFLEKVHYGL